VAAFLGFRSLVAYLVEGDITGTFADEAVDLVALGLEAFDGLLLSAVGTGFVFGVYLGDKVA